MHRFGRIVAEINAARKAQAGSSSISIVLLSVLHMCTFAEDLSDFRWSLSKQNLRKRRIQMEKQEECRCLCESG